MDTDPAKGKTPDPAMPPSGGRASRGGTQRNPSISGTGCKQVEARVMSKVLESPVVKHKSYVQDRERGPVYNIGVNLLEQFDEASDFDEDVMMVQDGRAALEVVVEPEANLEKEKKKKWVLF
jgi:hypothetical protein